MRNSFSPIHEWLIEISNNPDRLTRKLDDDQKARVKKLALFVHGAINKSAMTSPGQKMAVAMMLYELVTKKYDSSPLKVIPVATFINSCSVE